MFKKKNYNTDKETAKIQTVEPIRSKKHIRQICEYFMDRGLFKYCVLFRLGIHTGLRVGDLIRLKVKEVYRKDKILLREQKTGKSKGFALKPSIQEMLNSYCEGRDLESYVFEGTNHEPIDRVQVYRMINEACAFIGIKDNVGTHTMRKTFGYHHYRQFNNIALLQEIFNHSEASTTQRYIGITQDEIDRTYLELDLEDEEGNEFSVFNVDLRPVATAGDKLACINRFIMGYLKSGAQEYKPFAMIILEIQKYAGDRMHKVIVENKHFQWAKLIRKNEDKVEEETSRAS